MAHYKNYEKYKHLIGTQINGWTILDIIVRKEDHHVKTLAQCRCGTIKEVRLTYITNNKVKDCGCGHRNRLKETIKNKYAHLINATINGWTILTIIPPDDVNGITFALCCCQCGTIKEVRLSYILNGYSKDCGCGRKNTMREIFTNNLVGQRFGKLVAIELLEESNKFKRRLYRCKCDCGNEVIVPSVSLISEHTRSCGCLNSYHNMYINKLLTDKNIKFKPEFSVFINNKHFRYDFYLYDFNLMIEYDGEQHYMPVNFGSMSEEEANNNFKKIQLHDQIKNKYCEDSHINLLRIPYWESKNIETIISNHLQRLSEKGFAEAC